MGIRLALGASPRSLARLMLGQSVVPVALGIAAGIADTRAVVGWAESRLVGSSFTIRGPSSSRCRSSWLLR
jgi:hypothetical protein